MSSRRDTRSMPVGSVGPRLDELLVAVVRIRALGVWPAIDDGELVAAPDGRRRADRDVLLAVRHLDELLEVLAWRADVPALEAGGERADLEVVRLPPLAHVAAVDQALRGERHALEDDVLQVQVQGADADPLRAERALPLVESAVLAHRPRAGRRLLGDG